MIRSWCCLYVYFYVMFCRCAPTKNNMIYSPDHWSPLNIVHNPHRPQWECSVFCLFEANGKLHSAAVFIIMFSPSVWPIEQRATYINYDRNMMVFMAQQLRSLRLSKILVDSNIFLCFSFFIVAEIYMRYSHIYFHTAHQQSRWQTFINRGNSLDVLRLCVILSHFFFFLLLSLLQCSLNLL